MVLNSYKSYIVASLYVRSTAVPAVTVGQSDGGMDGYRYRKIPEKVEVFILPRKIVLLPANDFVLPSKIVPTDTHKNHPLTRRLSHVNALCDSLIFRHTKRGAYAPLGGKLRYQVVLR